MGRVTSIAHEKRAQIIAFSKAGWATRKIAEELGCSQSAVVKTKQRFEQTQSVNDRPRTGRPSKITIRDLRSIVYSVKKNRRLTSREIKADVRSYLKKDVGASTIRRLLFKYGLKGRVARKKPYISSINRKKRLKFAREHRNWTFEQWMRVLWTDEKKFNRRGSDGRVYVRRTPTEELKPYCLQGTIKGGGGSIMAWASFSASGPGPIHKFTGNVDRYDYIDMIEAIAVPYMREAMDPAAIFQHDNAPIHKAREVAECLERNNMTVLNWPPQSPDLNPIENLWTVIDEVIKEKKPANLSQLEEIIKDAWMNIPQSKCEKLVKSMQRRCIHVIKNLGYPTRY